MTTFQAQSGPDRIENILRRTYYVVRNLGIVACLGFVLWCCAHGEAYCSFYPAIDTIFAPQYTEKGFDRIAIGITVEEVVQILGEPLEKGRASDQPLEYSYTSDGKCWWGDFAWLGRTVYFRDGRVSQTEKRIYYD